MGDKAFCIHGHFYQPPREDPITGEIPLEPGAAPYSNWNERIFEQCYRPNVELGNFKRTSFNVGPTLFHWWKKFDPVSHSQVVSADSENLSMNGVGNAMAQSYNHTILPLSSTEDKITQVRWGIADFEAAYSHKPQGMWLPETAVDLETLDVLARNGIEFTILAPWQVYRKHLDTSRPYWVSLPGDRRIAVFFYHQLLSGQVSFNPEMTINGDKFFENEIVLRLNRYERKSFDEFLLIASDGELYGHHQPFRDKFLEYITLQGMKNKNVHLSYPGLWLKEHTPEKEIKIKERTSWSCHHGVTRWADICFCTPNGSWKKPLRMALDKIAERLDNGYFQFARNYVDDPWEFRHSYYPVLVRKVTIEQLLKQHGYKQQDPEITSKFSLLMKSQCERQRMFTSCGWFFDDLDRIEPLNNVAYAAQAAWLSNRALGVDICTEAAGWMKSVVSWRTGLRADTVFLHHYNKARERIVLETGRKKERSG